MSGYQHIRCKQAIAALELVTGEGKRPGYIWRFVWPELVTIEATADDDWSTRFDLFAAPPTPSYTVTMRGQANGLFVADMDSYFADQAAIAPHVPAIEAPGRTA